MFLITKQWTKLSFAYFSKYLPNILSLDELLIEWQLDTIFVQYFVKFFYICCSVAPLCLTLFYFRLPCPSLSPGACTNACPLSWWCHPIISSSLVPLSWLQSFPASGSFPVSWLFASGSQSIGASASVHAMNIQGWFSLRLTGLISLLSKALSRVFSDTKFESINSLALSLLYGPTLTSIHDYWRDHSFD